MILLDWMLGNESAEDLLPDIVRLDPVPPVVLFSAAPAAQHVADKWSILFIKKPFDLDTLLDALARNAAHRTSVPSTPP